MTTLTQTIDTIQYDNKPPQVAANLRSQKCPSDARSASLGTTANITAKTDILSDKQAAETQKYRLLSFGITLLEKANVKAPRSDKPHRTRLCHKIVAQTAHNPTIRLSRDDMQSRASIGQVQTCTCVWSCPVCASRKAIEKGNEIREAMRWAKHARKKPVMLTLTARHNAGMKLARFKTSFSKSWAWFSNHRNWKEFKAKYGIEHWIANREITHGINGWHYHMHIILFLDAQTIAQHDNMEVIQDDLTGHWLNALQKQGLEGLPEYALKVTANENIGDKYLAKLGLIADAVTGDLSHELTGSAYKDSRTIWDILRHASYGDLEAGRLYVEFVEAMTGDNWITWSRGLHALVSEFIDQNTDIESQADDKPTMVNWINISNYWWTVVNIARAYHVIVDVAARTRDIDEVRQCLSDLRTNLMDAQTLPDYHKEYLPIPYSIADVSIHEDWKNEILYCGSEA